MPVRKPPRHRISHHRPGRLRRAGAIGLGALGALALAPSHAPAVDAAVGQVLTLGAAGNHGVAEGRAVTGIARSGTGRGYWLASADGGVYAFGDAAFRGSAASRPLRQPVVDIAGAPGPGYWLVARDGGVFAFGDAPFLGSVGDVQLNAPVVGMAATPSGKGYWLASSDGGVFAFGDAVFHGSAGGTPLNDQIVAMASSPSGKGYWLLARDGGVFAFGDATFAGSPAAGHAPYVDLAVAPDGKGYWVATAGGTVAAFGSAPAHAGPSGGAPAAPVSAIDATPSGDGVWLATGGRPLGDFGVTCYALRGSTASGAPVSSDVVAVDPRTVPMGSEIYVAGLGMRRALDTGPAIRGRRLDIWNPSVQYCREFGIQRLTAYVIA